MDYYRSQPPMAGLSSALAMQGRMGDSTLVHMNVEDNVPGRQSVDQP